MKAAKLAWPGNDVPLFKGNLANFQKLDKLVEHLKDTCCTKHFGEKEIRLHTVNTLAERRHRIKKVLITMRYNCKFIVKITHCGNLCCFSHQPRR